MQIKKISILTSKNSPFWLAMGVMYGENLSEDNPRW